MQWFEIDKQGLASLLARRGKAFVLFELISNGWDESVTQVSVSLTRVAGTRHVRLVVEDDNQDGFADLSHAFTLFAESKKKGDADKRGRFNLGEKLVLALCDEAEIVSTRGTVRFDSAGRHSSRARRPSGSVFSGLLKMTNEEMAECHDAVRRLLPPRGIRTVYNGELLATSTPLAEMTATLMTEIADDEGQLRRTKRKCAIEVYEPLHGGPGMVYELGIPVVESGDRYDINVMQKVPLNLERDNVPPAYLARLRALVVEQMRSELTTEDANSTWVRDALQRHGHELAPETVAQLTELRFGAKRVSYDPTDPEANSLAMAQGYTVVYGSQLSKPEWEAVKRSGAILPAGQVTPSPKPYAEGGKPLRLLDEAQWTPAIRSVAAYAQRLAQSVLGATITVAVTNEVTWPFAATYGPGHLVLNLGRLGHKWFVGPLADINELLIHEFGHHYELNHLSSNFHDALCRIGARLATLALKEPELFVLEQHNGVAAVDMAPGRTGTLTPTHGAAHG